MLYSNMSIQVWGFLRKACPCDRLPCPDVSHLCPIIPALLMYLSLSCPQSFITACIVHYRDFAIRAAVWMYSEIIITHMEDSVSYNALWKEVYNQWWLITNIHHHALCSCFKADFPGVCVCVFLFPFLCTSVNEATLMKRQEQNYNTRSCWFTGTRKQQLKGKERKMSWFYKKRSFYENKVVILCSFVLEGKHQQF